MAVLLPKELLSNFSVPALPFHPVALSVLFIVAKFSECTSLEFPSSLGIRIGKCYSPSFTVEGRDQMEVRSLPKNPHRHAVTRQMFIY